MNDFSYRSVILTDASRALPREMITFIYIVAYRDHFTTNGLFIPSYTEKDIFVQWLETRHYVKVD